MLRDAYHRLAEGSNNYSRVTPAVEAFAKEVALTPTQVLAYLHRRWAREVKHEDTRSRKLGADPKKRRKAPDSDGVKSPRPSKARKARETDAPQQVDAGAIVDMLISGHGADSERPVAFRLGLLGADDARRGSGEDGTRYIRSLCWTLC
jgi:hypothetical protein